MLRRSLCCWVTVLGLTLGYACAGSPGMLVSTSAHPSAVGSRATLGPGDTIEVRVYQQKDLSGLFQVSQRGYIDYPLLGPVEVAGLTASQVARKLAKMLSDGYLREPFVTVTIKELVSKRIYVLGEVAKPGTFPYQNGMTIIHAITLAGGFTKSASPNSVVVTRSLEGKEVHATVRVGDITRGKAKNFYLQPGDIVFVPESVL